MDVVVVVVVVVSGHPSTIQGTSCFLIQYFHLDCITPLDILLDRPDIRCAVKWHGILWHGMA